MSITAWQSIVALQHSQDLNPGTCSSLVIFMYWACKHHTFNATPTEKLQQHPFVFAIYQILPLVFNFPNEFTFYPQFIQKLNQRSYNVS